MPLSIKNIGHHVLCQHFPNLPKPCFDSVNKSHDEDLREMMVVLSPYLWEDITLNLASDYAQDLALLPFEICNYYFPGFLLQGISLAESNGEISILHFLQCLYDKRVGKNRSMARLTALTDDQRQFANALVLSDLTSLFGEGN